MPDHDGTLPEAVRSELRDIGRTDIVVSDGGSEDATIMTARAAGVGDLAERYLVDPSTPEPRKVAFAYGGLPGKGSAFRAVFEVARDLEASACAVVDSDLRSIRPFWMDHLLTPVLRAARSALRGAKRVAHGRGPLRHRHLDDHDRGGRGVPGLSGAPRRQDPRPQGPGVRPRPHVLSGRRDPVRAGRRVSRAVGARRRGPRSAQVRAADRGLPGARAHLAPPAGVEVRRRLGAAPVAVAR